MSAFSLLFRKTNLITKKIFSQANLRKEITRKENNFSEKTPRRGGESSHMLKQNYSTLRTLKKIETWYFSFLSFFHT